MSMEDLLINDEWILFQIKEGPCTAACTYCYETPVVKNILNNFSRKGVIRDEDYKNLDNRQLASFITKNKKKLGLEFDINELSNYFSLLKELKIPRAGLIGSEPTQHSEFNKILDSAKNNNLELLVYTSGMHIEKLNHSAVQYVVLHLDTHNVQRHKKILSDQYMNQINEFINEGKLIDLRVNFSDPSLNDRNIIFQFYDKLSLDNQKKVLLKYSFNTKVSGQDDLSYFTPDSLRGISDKIIGFVDEFKNLYPNTPMLSERPLFPCSFDENQWSEYSTKGGFTSKCDMEFTIYPNTGMALCPPARDLIQHNKPTSAKELYEKIIELKKTMNEMYLTGSFEECLPCNERIKQNCQGGCLGYKVGLYNK